MVSGLPFIMSMWVKISDWLVGDGTYFASHCLKNQSALDVGVQMFLFG